MPRDVCPWGEGGIDVAVPYSHSYNHENKIFLKILQSDSIVLILMSGKTLETSHMRMNNNCNSFFKLVHQKVVCRIF